ncbi:hypothetical protein [Prochlorococcus marinus]|uniref:hypothetical protein n=1 Tax=Prochlorococcus marinus TaxID=1219 RepID=UPI0022B59764|nr:hypothetical protein [Prochlorococcus marinus]
MSESKASPKKDKAEDRNEKNGKRNHILSKNKNQKRLPLWVEVFFVQLGLPEKWLISILAVKRNGFNNFKENLAANKLIVIVGIVLIYCYPIIQLTKNQNDCVRESMDVLKESSISNNSVKSVAVNYCNGGKLLNN